MFPSCEVARRRRDVRPFVGVGLRHDAEPAAESVEIGAAVASNIAHLWCGDGQGTDVRSRRIGGVPAGIRSSPTQIMPCWAANAARSKWVLSLSPDILFEFVKPAANLSFQRGPSIHRSTVDSRNPFITANSEPK